MGLRAAALVSDWRHMSLRFVGFYYGRPEEVHYLDGNDSAIEVPYVESVNTVELVWDVQRDDFVQVAT